jgi:hypothetical protein
VRRDLVDAAFVQQEDGRNYILANSLSGSPANVLRMELDTETIRHSAETIYRLWPRNSLSRMPFWTAGPRSTMMSPSIVAAAVDVGQALPPGQSSQGITRILSTLNMNVRERPDGKSVNLLASLPQDYVPAGITRPTDGQTTEDLQAS